MSVPEELIARAQAGDIQAKEQLVSENAGLIWAVARRFQGRGTELADSKAEEKQMLRFTVEQPLKKYVFLL